MIVNRIGLSSFIGTVAFILYAQSLRSRNKRHWNKCPEKLQNIVNICEEGKSIEKLANRHPLLVCTRVHMKSADSMPQVEKILKFMEEVSSYADHIIICIGAPDIPFLQSYMDKLSVAMKAKSAALNNLVSLLPVQPWGHFVSPLNAAVIYAQDKGYQRIAFQVIPHHSICNK